MESFRDMGQRVRVHLCYAHVFRDALTRAEFVDRCCPENPALVDQELALLEADGLVERLGEYYFLRGQGDADLGEVKRVRQRRARAILEEHRRVIDVLRWLPFVRTLAISGSLSRDHPVSGTGKPVDLDLFMITSPSAMHIVRFILRTVGIASRLLVALRLTRKRATLCPNYITESSFPEITNRSFYTATDALHVKVLKGEDEYRRFMAANPWIGQYYPVRLCGPAPDGERQPRFGVRRIVNILCFAALGSSSCIKARLAGRPSPYSVSFRFDRSISFRRAAPPGGGHQPRVARRFDQIYRRYFEADEELSEFLFPGTTSSGVYHGGIHAASISEPLAYDE